MTVNIVVDLASAAVGYVAAVFTPAVASEVKFWFVATSTAVVADATAAVKDVAAKL